MSASTERKQRQAAREAGTDKKILALEKEAKAKAKSKLRWTLGTAAVALLIVTVLLLNSSLVYKATAYTVGSRKFSTAETSYYYATQYNNFVNQYGSYASLFGLNTSDGINGLDKQVYSEEDGTTWKDYFLDAARQNMQQLTVLTGYAADNGITLDEQELAEVEASFDGIEETAKNYGYADADKMVAMNYGTGVNVAMLRAAYKEARLAAKTFQTVEDSFTYTDEQIEEKYDSFNGDRDLFTYSYCYVAAEEVPVDSADGQSGEVPAGSDGEEAAEPATAVTEETLAQARATAEAIVAAYEKAAGTLPAARLNNAAAAEGQHAIEQTRVTGSSLYFAADWLKDAARQPGDVVTEDDENGCYVVVFVARDDNHYNTASVRHILIKAEADEDGNYTDEAKAAAKARAEEILAEFESGDKTEDSFAALAEQYSEDTGSNTNGGLYENIYKGQMVEEFDAFCFDTHEHGDTGIVYGEAAGSYAGYHVIYYVGQGGLYSSYLAEQELRSEDVNAWLEDALAALPTKDGFGMKFVG